VPKSNTSFVGSEVAPSAGLILHQTGFRGLSAKIFARLLLRGHEVENSWEGHMRTLAIIGLSAILAAGPGLSPSSAGADGAKYPDWRGAWQRWAPPDPFKGPRDYDGTGLPLHFDNQSIFKERLYRDRTDPKILHDEVTVIDHALTRPSNSHFGEEHDFEGV
jgi:hypothetical protein